MKTVMIACLILVQEPERPQERPPVTPPIPSLGPPGGQDEVQKKMLELFAKVERKLREVDVLLFDASAGETGLAPVEESGIGDLLQNALSSGREVQTGIEEILELARQNRPQSQSQSSSPQQGKEPGGSPLDQQRNQDGGQREQTPTMPQQGDEKPEQQDQNGRPDDPGADRDVDPGNRPAGDPPKSETERVGVPSSAERWGTLPVHVREIFRVEGADDLPPQYRDWIDGYYRRLAQIQRP